MLIPVIQTSTNQYSHKVSLTALIIDELKMRFRYAVKYKEQKKKVIETLEKRRVENRTGGHLKRRPRRDVDAVQPGHDADKSSRHEGVRIQPDAIPNTVTHTE